MPPKPRTLALTALTGLAMAAIAAVPPAQAAAAPDTIRYASVKACKAKNDVQVPCGPWRLTMRGGRTLKLTDARTKPRDAKGRVLKDQAAPIAVSGDGRTVAYFRESDDRLVVRRIGGKVRVMKGAPAKGVGMEEISLYLSQDGGRLAVDVGDEAEKQPTLVYDVSTGRDPGKVPGSLAFNGFSGDGETVLTAELTGDNTTRLITYGAGGERGTAAEPPQIVANNSPYGLASDGRTVAFFSGPVKKFALRLYDLESDEVVQSTLVKLGGSDLPEVITWTGDDEVTVHVSHTTKDDRTAMRILEIDTESGDVRVRDSYTVRSDAYGYAACGA